MSTVDTSVRVAPWMFYVGIANRIVMDNIVFYVFIQARSADMMKSFF